MPVEHVATVIEFIPPVSDVGKARRCWHLTNDRELRGGFLRIRTVSG